MTALNISVLLPTRHRLSETRPVMKSLTLLDTVERLLYTKREMGKQHKACLMRFTETRSPASEFH